VLSIDATEPDLSIDLFALHGEIDRQLADVRAACDGLATRSGLLIAASGVAAAVFAPRVQVGHHQSLLVVTLLIFAIATLSGGIILVPWLQVGPRPTSLAGWVVVPTQATSAALYDTKLTVLDGNLGRMQLMRIFLVIQAVTTLSAVGLALWYSAWK
jgi:hypothetical protein